MERKRAWITAGVVAVTFSTAALAVMANTGLLAVTPSDRNVGRLNQADIAIAPLQGSTLATTAPVPTVRYEDVYVTLPPIGAPPQVVATSGPASASTIAEPVRNRRTAATTVEHEQAEHEQAEHEQAEHEGETHEGEEDDD